MTYFKERARSPASVIAILTMALRGIALASRFALSLYIVRYIDIASLGAFGLTAGIAGIMPAVLGLGINYHLNRDIMLLPRPDAGAATRDRLLVSMAMLSLAWIGAAVLYPWTSDMLGPYPILVGAIVSLETIATDLHLIIINRGHALFANLLLFVRSASWIPPVICLGLFLPSMRSLFVIFVAWLIALMVSGVMCAFVLSRRFPASFWLKRPDIGAILARARINPLIYVNDLGLVGQTYLDRFLIFWLLGSEATGLYTFVFSITNGLYVLVHVSTVQVALPSLSKALGDSGRWRDVLTGYIRQAAAFGLCIAAVVTGMLAYALPKLDNHQLSEQKGLFLLMACAAVMKPISDLFNVGLYSLKRDHLVALLNTAAIVMGAGMSIAAIQFFGLPGVGIASLLSVLLLAFARSTAAGYWRRPAAGMRP